MYRREKYEEAAHRYQYAVRRVPQFISSEDSATFEQLKVHLYLNLSRCCKKQGLFDEAAKHASSVLKLKPDSIEALKARASALKESGKYQEAISDLNEALRQSPQNRDLHKLILRIKEESRYNNNSVLDDFKFVDDSSSEFSVSTVKNL